MHQERTHSGQEKNDHLSESLGMRIRQIRLRQSMTIAELADMTGLTASTISQVERAIISPSISTLKKIGNAMGIPLSYLFESTEPQPTPRSTLPENSYMPFGGMADLDSYLKSFANGLNMGYSPVVHKHERKILSPGQGIRFYLLNPTLAGPIEFIYNEYDPGATTGPNLYSHPGCECGLILSGELIIQINEDVYVLQEGDSITFNSTDPHLKKNDGAAMCTCIWANVPPWF